MGNTVKIDPVGLREELKVLSLDKLKVAYESYGIADLWKNGTNKAIAVDIAVNAIINKQNAPEASKEVEEEKPVTETPEASKEGQGDTGSEEVEEEVSEEIEPGEYEIDQETLDIFPELSKQGFNVGDILVVEEGKPWSKKQDVVEEVEEPYADSQEGTKNIATQKTIEEADKEIKGDNADIKPEDVTDLNDDPAKGSWKDEDFDENGNKVVKEYEPEVIDESKYTEEEILENIEICQANFKDAIPTTRILLLRKQEALEAALERKRK